ncbi:hypothetical protein ACIBCT_40385 [Streptosporangium sp. NPDC050855]|uniref:hypothetical protein n=1 Tax=Streptosporangium sp. NPDC050855 TaxID=3366194 RepID=UPI0037A023F6
MTGGTPTAIRLAAAGTALAALFTGSGTALAGTGADAGTTGTARIPGGTVPAATAGLTGQGATAVRIPRNFLPHEAQARRPVRYSREEKWTIRDGVRGPLEIEPCGPRRGHRAARISARGHDVRGYDAEGVRPAVGGQRTVVRRDRALAIHTPAGEHGRVRDSGFTRPPKNAEGRREDAERTAAGVCSLPGPC